MNHDTPGDDDALTRQLHASRQLLDAPDAVVQRAILLFQAAPAAAPPVPGLLRRLVATLSFDSAGLSPLALGLRSAAPQARQLLYSTEGRDVDLRVVASADGRGVVISGQVLGPDAAGTAELRCADRVLTAPWNDLCEFSFEPIASGPCTVTLQAAGWELELPALQISAA